MNSNFFSLEPQALAAGVMDSTPNPDIPDASAFGSGDQAELDFHARFKPELQALIKTLPDPLADVDLDLYDKLSPGEQTRVLNDKTACLAESLDAAGLHRVTMIRKSGDHAGVFHLDDFAESEDFIARAVRRLCLPDEDPDVLGKELRKLICQKLEQYEQTTNHVLVEPLSKIMPAEVEWLWPGYLAADKLAVLVGEPGVGKTLTALDIAARVTTGAPWPTDPPNTQRRQPASVILLSEMDDSADTLCPRLEAVGADLSRVHLVCTFVCPGESQAALPFSVGGSLDMLAACVNKVPDCRLVIIDPLSLYVEGSLNRRQITKLLGNLIELAIDKELAILVVSHFGRSQFHYASQLTAKFVAAARTVWRIVDDSHNVGRRVLLPMKNNLGTDRHGLAFHIQEEVDALFPAPKVVWEQKQFEIGVQRTTFETESARALPNSYAVHRRMIHQWLKDQLGKGERFAQDVLAAATLARIGRRTLRLALREIGGTTRKGTTGLWVWALPDQSIDRSSSDTASEFTIESCKTSCQVGQVGRVGTLDGRMHLEETRQFT